jgi:hypothetical protein
MPEDQGGRGCGPLCLSLASVWCSVLLSRVFRSPIPDPTRVTAAAYHCRDVPRQDMVRGRAYTATPLVRDNMSVSVLHCCHSLGAGLLIGKRVGSTAVPAAQMISP